VQAEIGEVLSGQISAPIGRRTLFKSVGMAIEDLVGAKLVWQARSREPLPGK
jgi:thiomorpholine-carboxylate dehydrogenase